MELEVIRHKTARQFFDGFYPAEQVDSYAYQLERMFEQGSAVEGDLFVVSENDEPYISVEIYRNNTRRILERAPLTALNKNLNSEQFKEAVKIIMEYLNDEIISGPTDKDLQIDLDENFEYYKEYDSVIKEFDFINVVSVAQYSIATDLAKSISDRDIFFKNLIDYEVEDRFKMIPKSSFNELYKKYPAEKIYTDLLEEGYQSEEIWEAYKINDEIKGFLMPSFTNGLKNRIELINYGCYNRSIEKEFYRSVTKRLIQLTLSNDVDELVINININDKEFIDQVLSLGFTKNGIIRKYIRK